MADRNFQFRKRVDALTDWIEGRTGLPVGEDATAGFPEAAGLAVCTGISSDVAGEQAVLYEPVWVPGEVVFLDRFGNCLVTPRRPGPPGTFEYFDVRDLRKAIACSKRIVNALLTH